jgi:HEAT repeat protein
MSLFFCPSCRRAAFGQEICPKCGIPSNSPAMDYPEKLLETILSPDTSRAGMAVDVLTKNLHDPRTIVPLILLLHKEGDPYLLVLASRGLGALGDPQAIPELVELLLDEGKPFVARIASAEALGAIGGKEARQALEAAQRSRRPSVVKASTRALQQLKNER